MAVDFRRHFSWAVELKDLTKKNVLGLFFIYSCGGSFLYQLVFGEARKKRDAKGMKDNNEAEEKTKVIRDRSKYVFSQK